MFQIKTFPSHVLLSNSWAMNVECQSKKICIVFFYPRGLTTIDMKHCPIQGTCWAFLRQAHAVWVELLWMKNCFWTQFQFTISMSVSCCRSNIKSSEIKRHSAENPSSLNKLMQTRLFDKMSRPSHCSFCTAMEEAMRHGNENPARCKRCEFD